MSSYSCFGLADVQRYAALLLSTDFAVSPSDRSLASRLSDPQDHCLHLSTDTRGAGTLFGQVSSAVVRLIS